MVSINPNWERSVRVSIAPMMAYTDRHYRYFMRLITKHTRLYTEMVTANALHYCAKEGNRERLLAYDMSEHPIALQVGCADPVLMTEAAGLAEQFGFDEVNINVGCPSDRVQHARFGACLMREPELVAKMVEQMARAVSIPVTVKTRIGIDDQENEDFLYDFVNRVSQAGCESFIIHARKAWLKGLSPAQNRHIPPLNYGRVYWLKQAFPQLNIVINGGVQSLEETQQHLKRLDGVMIGRKAFHDPYLFATVDRDFFDPKASVLTREEVLTQYREYMEDQLTQGVTLNRLLHGILGLQQGQPGARKWRRSLSDRPTVAAVMDSLLDL